MKGRPWPVAIVIAVGVSMVLVVAYLRSAKELATTSAELAHYRDAAADLAKHARDAESERDSANRTIRELRTEVAALQQQRKGDSLVIEALWHELGPRATGTDKAARYNWETIKDMLASSEDVAQDLVAQILTPEEIQATLEDHKGDPTYWVAAASLMRDKDAALKYLEEAAKLYPRSAVVLSSLVESLMAREQFDETTMAHIATLKQVDPANSLPDYYEANCRFQSGDIQGALQSLREASLKDRFADNRMDVLMAQYDYFVNGGCSDSTAKGLAALNVLFNHIAVVRGAGQNAMEQARASTAAGQYEEALRIADSVLRTGSNLSSSGRFLLYDLVGMALQKSALNEQRRIYEAWGNAFQVEQIDSQLASVEDRLSLMKAMTRSSAAAFEDMTEEDIANYVAGIIRNGEFSTLRDWPGVAEAVRRAREEAR